MGFAGPEQRTGRPRKIRLDRDVYCAHSLRASGGDANCDHDFELTPTIAEAEFATWKCTKCGREFSYETWKTAGKTAKRSPPPR
jgi:hypothetical protein